MSESSSFQHHIRWSGAPALDWDCFTAAEEAKYYAETNGPLGRRLCSYSVRDDIDCDPVCTYLSLCVPSM